MRYKKIYAITLFVATVGVAHAQTAAFLRRPTLLRILFSSSDSRSTDKFNNDRLEGVLNLLDARIREAERNRPATNTTVAPATIVRRYRSGQWQVVETQNSRVFSTDDKLAERAARNVEEYRKACFDFLKCDASDWTPKVDVYIHDSAEQYARITRQGPGSPGHSQTGIDRGKITSRRIDLRRDGPDVLTAILPHELCHVVLADSCSNPAAPRWLDEGLAVLQEPRLKAEAHLKNLKDMQQSGRMFTAKQLMMMNDYPPGQQWPMFYAESVALVSFFVERGGADKLIAFQKEAFVAGYEAALKKYYKINNFDELESQFRQWLASELSKL